MQGAGRINIHATYDTNQLFWHLFRGPYLPIRPSTDNTEPVRKIKTTGNNVILPKVRIFLCNYSTTVKKYSNKF